VREGSLCLLEDGGPVRALILAAEDIRIAREAGNIDLEMLGRAVQGLSPIRHRQLMPLDGRLTPIEMAEAPDHTLWFSSLKGVIRISEQKLANDGDTNVPLDYEVFNRTDGLNTTEASAGAPNIAIDSNGKLRIATVKGLAVIDTLRLPIAGRNPTVFITGVSIDARRYSVETGLILPPGESIMSNWI
jgi:hypothetical protein